MKTRSTLLLALPFFLLIFGCSKQKDVLQPLFPLGINVEEAMEDEQISSKKSQCGFIPEDAVKEQLSENYQCNEEGRGAVHEEDNFGTIKDLENVTALGIQNYKKDGILYQKVILLFKNDELIQVYAETEGKSEVSLVNAKVKSMKSIVGEPVKREFSQTYYFDTPETMYYDALQFKDGNVYFEIDARHFGNDRIYYTYYTKKVLPLFGVDY